MKPEDTPVLTYATRAALQAVEQLELSPVVKARVQAAVIAAQERVAKGETMTAYEEFTQLRDTYQRTHNCTALEASNAINQQRPDLWVPASKQSGQHVRVTKAAPPPVHTAVQHLEALTLARMVQQPGLTHTAAMRDVLKTDEGQRLEKQYYADNPQFGRRG